MQTETELLLYSVKLIQHISSALSACYNPCVGPLPKIKAFFFAVINLCY